MKLVNNISSRPLDRNLCFVNASLQMIASVSVLKDYFLEKKYSFSCNGQFPLCDEIFKIFSGLSVSARLLRYFVGNKPNLGYFSDGSQQDGASFLNVLFDLINEEINLNQNRPVDEFLSFFRGKQSFLKRFLGTDNGSCIRCTFLPQPVFEDFTFWLRQQP